MSMHVKQTFLYNFLKIQKDCENNLKKIGNNTARGDCGYCSSGD